MEQLNVYMNSMESSAVIDWMLDHLDFLAYTLGFYMVFLFWCPVFIKSILISTGIFNPSLKGKRSDGMPPLGSATIASIQLLCNIIFGFVAFNGALGVAYPVWESTQQIGFHNTVCFEQKALLERGPVIFWICVLCVFLYLDILYTGLITAQNVYKQLEVARSRGFPVPVKVTSGVRFIEYVYRAATMAAPWVMLAIGFSAVTLPVTIGFSAMFVQHALSAMQNVAVILAPAAAAKNEFKLLVVRNVARLIEGLIGFSSILYILLASGCEATDFIGRIALVYYFFTIFFMRIDLLKMYHTRENPMDSFYENDLPENRLQRAKQN